MFRFLWYIHCMLLMLRKFIAFILIILGRTALTFLFCFGVLHEGLLHSCINVCHKCKRSCVWLILSVCWLSYQELMDLPYLFPCIFPLCLEPREVRLCGSSETEQEKCREHTIFFLDFFSPAFLFLQGSHAWLC